MSDSGQRLGRGLEALWRQPMGFLPQAPVSSGALVWSYADELRPACLDAAASVTAEEAERRVVLLTSGELGPPARTTHSHVAGLQVLLPGESAPPHRHTPAALRFHLQGDGAVTDVDGEAVPMRLHDLVLTPSTSWHSHHCEPGDEPVIWLDGVDLPVVRSVDAAFFGNLPGDEHHPRSVRQLCYPWDVQVAALDTAATSAAGPFVSVPYPGPDDGPLMPTFAAAAHQLEPAATHDLPRRTAGSVHVVVEGSLSLTAAGSRHDLAEHDVFVLQPWTDARLETSDERARLFSFDDSPVLRSLGLYREASGADHQR